VRALALGASPRVLDVGTGTGDLALDIARIHPDATVIGLDPSSQMLAIADAKRTRLGLADRVTLVTGDAQQLAFRDGEMDAVTIAFCIRNVPDRPKALREMARVVRPGGWVLAEFYNARSLRRLVKAIKPPTAVSETAHDEHVFTRYDDARAIRSYLPPELTWVATRGIRVITPVAKVLEVPVLGAAVRWAEHRLADLPGARSAGGFLVACCQRR
jgi:ubiquinone/menaquinone biosynthesis C-methylase UbiE